MQGGGRVTRGEGSQLLKPSMCSNSLQLLKHNDPQAGDVMPQCRGAPLDPNSIPVQWLLRV